MHANVVIAIGPEETLPAILAHIHQAGLGSNALLVRPRRTSIERQIERIGIPTGLMPERVNAADAALVIHAAGRSRIAADLTRQHGASATWIVSPKGSWDLVDDDIVAPPTEPARTITPHPHPTILAANPDESPDI